MEILQTVIEQERVYFPFVDGEFPAFHPVFVDQNNHVFQIVREHVGLVAGGDRIEK